MAPANAAKKVIADAKKKDARETKTASKLMKQREPTKQLPSIKRVAPVATETTHISPQNALASANFVAQFPTEQVIRVPAPFIGW